MRDKEEITIKIKEGFDSLETFSCPDDIPAIPILESSDEYQKIVVKNLIRCGAIPKDRLEIGKTYIGTCRCSEEATWDGEKFEYKRFKSGAYHNEKVNHFEDDDGYDIFVPIKEK